MLKSTYKPSPNVLPPLPPGWTEHKAPTGHTYFYNANTKESTYKRPGVDFASGPGPQQPPQPPPHDPNASYFQYSSIPNLSNPAAANAFLAQYDPARQRQQQELSGRGGRGGGHHRGGHGHGGEGRPRPQPADKPRSKVAIPGCEPWILVYTKYGRRFVYNPVKNASFWRIPEKVMKGILELDIKGIKEKAGGGSDDRDGEGRPSESAEPQTEAGKEPQPQQEEEEEYGSDYEEVEVTDDEGEEGAGGEGDDDGDGDENGEGQHRTKRQRTEDPGAGGEDNTNTHTMPVEFNEEDIVYQLQAMGADYGLDPGEYDDGNAEAWPEGAEGNPLSEADAIALFEDLLDDHGINPYSPWEKLLEEGRVFDDPRYTALATTKARREAWEAWSRSRIRALRERRAREAKERPPDDPRVPFFAFLHEKATSPKLYWPEFRRKHRKEPVMRDSALSDRDRERWYRDHVARLRLPLETRKKDLAALLRSVPLRLLNRRTDYRYHPPNQNQNRESDEEGGGGGLLPLPAQILTDVRFISLDAATRDPLVEAFIQTLPEPPPENEEGEVVDEEGQRKKQEEKRKREKALEERERVVAEEKRRQRRLLEQGRAALREEEREIERAMQVGKKGLQSQLEAAREKERERERERDQALALDKGKGEGEGEDIAEKMDTEP